MIGFTLDSVFICRFNHQNVFCIIPSVCQDLSVALYKHLLQEEASGCVFPKRKLYLLGFDLDPDLINRAQNSNPFPQNIQFIPLDLTDDAKSQAVLESYLGSFGCPRFHLCTCFAVTMWVHLNHGDAAFLSLLSRLASLCEYLLLEAQPWKCYRSAARRLRKLGRSDFDHFKTLEIRGDMAAHAREHLEKQCSMELMQSFGNTTWDRSLLLFRRR
ncbi:pre-miRNA 5'-monophosphate methyltransferase-like [Sinocyclocheilus grahami]|uniref:pre-miRNA 5'-monophosphate methyltransferase-like n=1 Tax=Sinocyclocheilus grahami TaxID=75366 RepID=UPI0007AC922F|nr:PREDICTED: pre-miRNA 5'-monophosphate methyltransferase-like [Sinocyclocheilus grahami]